ncbi:RING-H2 finger protein ATL51 [Apostasia shenzhenica]|uniref:RING-type E3 ubiquitin transferase n=1 Tax=Apostasia shenzhenica TaxID=1088818 RepID=A0A2I0BER4_9ASPA|nr:RING-H2 finger protein ATL51 [Apostasia shenzhenica]
MGNLQPWPPYVSPRDCSLGFCSMYCPQFCYFYLPPPPPSHSPTLALSPLLIAIIIVVSAAVLVIAGYILASKFFRHRSREAAAASATADSAPWLPNAVSSGLDESLISKITAYNYSRSGGSAASDGDCSVCLAEFRDGESLRRLPKCGHAFHQRCIDTWLKAHSSCPLCRAGVVSPAAAELAIMAAEEAETAGDVVLVVLPDEDSGGGGDHEQGEGRSGYEEEIGVMEEGGEAVGSPEELSAGSGAVIPLKRSASGRGSSGSLHL